MDKYNLLKKKLLRFSRLEQLEDTTNEEEFNDVREDIPDNAEDMKIEDEYTEVSDIEGPINSSMCDEIIDLEFSKMDLKQIIN